MRATYWPVGVPVLLLAVLYGCAPKPLVQTARQAPTGIHQDTAVGVMVLYHERCAEHRKTTESNCSPGEVTDRVNAKFARCVGAGFRDSRHRITTLPGSTIHGKYLAVAEPDYAKLTPDRVLELLLVPETAAALARDNVGYVVLLSATTTDHSREPMLDMEQGVWFLGAESRRLTVVDAAVFRSDGATFAGDLQLKIEGDSGWMMPVLYVIPLPPIPYGSRTESKACTAMGNAIADFLTSE